MDLSIAIEQIKEEVDIKVKTDNNFSQGVARYDNAIQSYLNEIKASSGDQERLKRVKKDYSDLHILKAELLYSYAQYKTSRDVYKKCSEDPNCNWSKNMWKSYISFYSSRQKYDKACHICRESISKLNKEDQNEILNLWVEFEHKNGNIDCKVSDLLDQKSVQSSPVSSVISSRNERGTVFDEIVLNDDDIVLKQPSKWTDSGAYPRFELHRQHRPLCLFQFPKPTLEQMSSDSESKTLPTSVLYALGCLMIDSTVLIIIEKLRAMQEKMLTELDKEQTQRAGEWQLKQSGIDPQQYSKQYSMYMKKVYDEENRRIYEMIKYQQNQLQQIGIPGFTISTEKADIEIQRYIIKLIELAQQKINKEKK